MNVVNLFFGKVVGVNVFIIFIGVVGFLWVVICGNNFFFGINQLLYVVDGIFIDNINLGFVGMWGGFDGGDGILFINFEDIEIIFVFKGVFVVVLYGYCFVNGVIFIIIKSGSKCKGIGVEFNFSVWIELFINIYDFQWEYGYGCNGIVFMIVDQVLEE